MKNHLQRILSSAVESAKMINPAKSSSASIKPDEKPRKVIQKAQKLTIVISIPKSKHPVSRGEYGFKLSEVDCEVVTDRLKTSMKLAYLGKRQINQSACRLQITLHSHMPQKVSH